MELVFLDEQEVMNRYRVSRILLRELCDKKKLRYYKEENSMLYCYDDLDKLFKPHLQLPDFCLEGESNDEKGLDLFEI